MSIFRQIVGIVGNVTKFLNFGNVRIFWMPKISFKAFVLKTKNFWKIPTIATALSFLNKFDKKHAVGILTYCRQLTDGSTIRQKYWNIAVLTLTTVLTVFFQNILILNLLFLRIQDFLIWQAEEVSKMLFLKI